MTITLNGSDLTVTQVIAAARHGEAVALAPAALAAMHQARIVVQALQHGEPVYGLTTPRRPSGGGHRRHLGGRHRRGGRPLTSPRRFGAPPWGKLVLCLTRTAR